MAGMFSDGINTAGEQTTLETGITLADWLPYLIPGIEERRDHLASTNLSACANSRYASS
jgi:hypothetical protein